MERKRIVLLLILLVGGFISIGLSHNSYGNYAILVALATQILTFTLAIWLDIIDRSLKTVITSIVIVLSCLVSIYLSYIDHGTAAFMVALVTLVITSHLLSITGTKKYK